MSLITIDDDSSEDLTIISSTENKDVAMKESSEQTSDNNSKSSSDNESLDTADLNDESNSKSNDTDLLLHQQAEGTDDSMTIDTGGNDDETNEKPILELMKHLINYNGKQNTMLTNAELIKMLKNEFHIDVANLPTISVDIYMNVLKKFLKEWPQWDEFDRVMHESRCMDDNEEIERMLEEKYAALKKYLAAMLKACRPYARESAQKFKGSNESSPPPPVVAGDVCLEVNCTRSQLNTLFFRKPNPNLNFTIFNVDDSLPSKINLSTPSLKSILNSCHIRLSISTKCFKYKRELIHDLKHKLVNKRNHQQTQDNRLNVHLQTPKGQPKQDQIISKKDIKAITNKISCTNKYMNLQPAETIFRVINEDVSVIQGDFGIPAVYRHYMNPYAYVRYLHKNIDTESDTESDKYDLHLEEKLSPRLTFQITKICFESTAANSSPSWLKVECVLCELTFLGLAGIEQLQEHFKEYHQDEPEFLCTNCDKKFSVNELALTRWYHKCVKDEASAICNSDTE